MFITFHKIPMVYCHGLSKTIASPLNFTSSYNLPQDNFNGYCLLKLLAVVGSYYADAIQMSVSL